MEQWAGNWLTISKYYGMEDNFEEFGNAFYAKNHISETSRDKKILYRHVNSWLKDFNIDTNIHSAFEFESVYLESFKDNYANERLLDKIEELKKDYSTGIFSNISIFDSVRQSKQTRDYTIFNYRFLSCDFGVCKPDTKFYKEVENYFDPKNIYYFDDMLNNVITARNRGWNAFCSKDEKEILDTINKIIVKLK